MAKLEIIVRKKKMLTVWIDEQWVSEKEMKDDLKWSPSFGFNQKNIERWSRAVSHTQSCLLKIDKTDYIYIYDL